MLDSAQAWSAASSSLNTDQWMIIDAGEVVSVTGILVQSRYNVNSGGQKVDSLKIATSNDNINWADINSGEVFLTNCVSIDDTKQNILFP